MDWPPSAAAKSRGASRASARSTQWADSVSDAPGRAAWARACAMATAWSKVSQPTTGDQRSLVTQRGRDTEPLGSNTKARPKSIRRQAVAISTSGFVEVETTAAGASRTVGITRVDVLPERGGPMISVAVSVPA